MNSNYITLTHNDDSKQARILGNDLNGIRITVAESSSITSIDDLDDLKLSAILQKNGQRPMILNNCRLSDLFKIGDYQGALKFSADQKNSTFINLGRINLSGAEQLTLQLDNESELTDLEVKIAVLDILQSNERITTFESITAGGDNQSLDDVKSIFCTSEFSGNATVKVAGENHIITYSDALETVQVLGQIETRLDHFGLIWANNRQSTSNVSAVLPSGNYIITRKLYT
ncbi:MAG: hypothetical protein ACOCRK_05165 [bacterium]